MRVMIVAANQEHKPDPVVPLGAACVAGAARAAGHEVRIFDACFKGDQAAAELGQQLAGFKPEVVGLSIRNVDDVCWPRAHSYLPHYLRLAQAIRTAAPQASLVLGGSAFTLMPERFLQALAPDHGIAGEGEHEFARLLAALQAGERPAALTRAVPGPFPTTAPALDLLDIDEYYRRGGALNVQTRRGCGFTCSYCTYPVLEGRNSRRNQVDAAVDQVESCLQRHGASHFFVVDNTFNHPADHAAAFCDELLRRELKVNWTAYLSPAGLEPGLLQLMARAGCGSVEFGTDAAAPATLAALGKSFDVTQIERVSQWSRQAGLKFAHSLILGGPDETPETLTQTVGVIETLKPDAVFAMLGVRLYPNTALARRAEREGLIRESELGIEPVFYISEAVSSTLEEFARALSAKHSNWFFPGLEGDRWLRFWRRRRAHGVRGPLWEWMAPATEEAKS